MTGRFLYAAFDAGVPPVQWVIRLDPRGAKSIVYRCKQVHPSPEEISERLCIGERTEHRPPMHLRCVPTVHVDGLNAGRVGRVAESPESRVALSTVYYSI